MTSYRKDMASHGALVTSHATASESEMAMTLGQLGTELALDILLERKESHQ